MLTTRLRPIAASLALLIAVAACGGGGGGGSHGGGGSAAGSDLVVTALAFTPAAVVAGQTIDVADTVTNQGSEIAYGVEVGIFLSSDPVIQITDVALGFRTLAELAPGATSTGGGTLTIPLATGAGTWHVGAIVDPLDAIVETSEANNGRAASPTLTVAAAPLPDLAMTSIGTGATHVDAGSPIDVSDSVANQGSAPAGSFQVGVYLSADAAVTTGDVLLGVRPVTSLAAGATSSGGSTLTVPAGLAAGTWWLGAVADRQAQVVESDEADNALVAASPVEVHRPPRPDLVVLDVTHAPGATDSGLPILVDVTVANQGPAASAACTVGLYLSTDAVVTSSDVPLGQRSLPALASGQVASASATHVVPVEIDPGTWWVGALADSAATVPEEDETNNGRIALLSLSVTVPPRPDLVPTSFSFGPGVIDPTQGVPLGASCSLTNAGVEPAGAFHVGVYLSTNAVISTSDVLAGGWSVTGLAVGAGESLTASFPLPAGLAAGSYHVGLVLDDQGAVLEQRESNNLILSGSMLDVVSTPTPLADLTVASASFAPAQANPGQTIQVTNEVRNVGTLSAGTFRVGVYLSTDATIAVDDLLLGERTVFQLGIGFGSVSSAPYTLPVGLAPGTWHVGVVADRLDDVTEILETNNGLRAGGLLTVVVPPPPMPDLVPTAFTFTPASAAPGAALAFEVTCRNAGDLAAPASRVGIYLSADAAVDAQDTLVAWQALGALAPGAVETLVIAGSVPAGLAPGSYHLAALVDDLATLAEEDEANNARAAASALVVP